jgi:DNA-binding transcriptional regulator LsrR (DeoR family)
VIQVQDWAEIRHLYFAEELSQRAIAERLGVARKTVGLR